MDTIKSLINGLAGRHRHRQQPSTSPTAALDKMPVEIQEAILLYLPLADILLAQRVSRRIRDVIAGSTKIQKALFKVPLRMPRTIYMLVFNPFVRLYVPVLLSTALEHHTDYSSELFEKAYSLRKATWHSCLRRRTEERLMFGVIEGQYSRPQDYQFGDRFVTSLVRLRTSQARLIKSSEAKKKSCSLQHMLLTQGPTYWQWATLHGLVQAAKKTPVLGDETHIDYRSNALEPIMTVSKDAWELTGWEMLALLGIGE